jgi:O-antigen/teichoic acid export membrane protein
MRGKKAILNFIAAIVELIVATISSFVVPHLIIHTYGSGVNGLISSITQFLSYIALIESGIGAIGRASLYKPLAEKNNELISGSTKAIENFYRKVAYGFLAYVVALSLIFPLLVNKDFDWLYTATLIIILAFSVFVQYYFGITYQTVIQADQKKYIPSLLQALTLLVNMLITILMINMGASIHAVKIGSALAYAIKPIVLYIFVRSHYRIDKKAKPRNEILKQRWDGLAQHIAFFIHNNTDIAVLTILTNVKEVSVYSIYMLAVSGCAKVVNIFSASLEPAFGNMIAKGEKETLKNRVDLCSTLTIQVSIILFSTVALVISPFVQLYTKGVTDIDYLRPNFGVVMLIAEALYCIRLPYQYAVYAAGHFKQTRNGAIIEATMNIVLSIILAFKFGLIGVAIGTLVSMLYRTIEYIIYYHRVLIQEKFGLVKELKKLCVSLFEISLIIILNHFIPAISYSSYKEWLLASFVLAIIISFIIFIISIILYRSYTTEIFLFIKRLFLK